MTSSRNARRKSCNRAINRAGNRWLSVTTSCMRWRTSPSLALLHKFSDRCRQLRNRQKFRQGFVELATRQFAQLRFWYMLREKRYCLWSPKQVCKLDRIDVWILGTPSNGLERDTAAIALLSFDDAAPIRYHRLCLRKMAWRANKRQLLKALRIQIELHRKTA